MAVDALRSYDSSDEVSKCTESVLFSEENSIEDVSKFALRAIVNLSAGSDANQARLTDHGACPGVCVCVCAVVTATRSLQRINWPGVNVVRS